MNRTQCILLLWLLITFGGFGIFLLVTPAWGALSWVVILACMLPVIMLGGDTRPGLQVMSWLIPHTQVVRTMDHDGEIRHVLAYGEPGTIMCAHIYWSSQIGTLKLHPNGLVQGVSYVYFWEPMHVEARTVMHLTYDCADWHQLKHMTWHDRDEYRFHLKQQAKLMNVTHI